MAKFIFVARTLSWSADWPKLLRLCRATTFTLHLTMPDKRKATMPTPSSKRPRISYDGDDDDGSSTASYERPRQHPLYGQKSAFPGLDDRGNELRYDDPEDGLEYLRMVRYV